MPYSPKKDNSTKIISIALLISRIIIGLGVRYVFFKDHRPASLGQQETEMQMNDTGSQLQEEKKNNKYYYGERILLLGKLTKEKFPQQWSHIFVSESGDRFGVKSKQINLSSFTGMVQIKGKVDDFKGDLPIIEIEEIMEHNKSKEDNNQNNDDHESNTQSYGNPDYFLFLEDGLGFDLSISKGYTVEKQGEKIVVLDIQEEQSKETMSISPFICTPGDNLRDCQMLKTRFENNNANSFISSQGIKFYHLSETKTWVTFHDNQKLGYYLTSQNENQFASFANLMSFVSEETVQSLFEKQVNKLCKDINSGIETIIDIDYERRNFGIVIATITGTNDKKENIVCILRTTLGNTSQVEKIDFKVSEGISKNDHNSNEKITTEKKDTQIGGSANNINNIDTQIDKYNNDTEIDAETYNTLKQPIDPPSNTTTSNQKNTETNSGQDGGLLYSSVRGYDIYFSEKSLMYQGEILEKEKTFGSTNRKCTYLIKVSPWTKDEENTEIISNPALQIYECHGSGTPDFDGNAKVQTLYHNDDILFLAQRYNNPRGNLQITIQEQEEE